MVRRREEMGEKYVGLTGPAGRGLAVRPLADVRLAREAWYQEIKTLGQGATTTGPWAARGLGF